MRSFQKYKKYLLTNIFSTLKILKYLMLSLMEQKRVLEFGRKLMALTGLIMSLDEELKHIISSVMNIASKRNSAPSLKNVERQEGFSNVAQCCK